VNFDLREHGLDTVVAEGRLVAAEAARTFGQLSPRQINWKPGPADWSIGQCFDHVIVSNQPYFGIVEEIVRGRKRASLWERLPVLPAICGRLIIGVLHPDSSRTAKARKRFLPSESAIDAGIVQAFVAQQDRLIGLMEATRGLDLDGIVVTSPVLAVTTYSLMDAYRIIVVHEQNHFVQVRRVLDTPGFPTS
jgi:hypothetical protein